MNKAVPARCLCPCWAPVSLLGALGLGLVSGPVPQEFIHLGAALPSVLVYLSPRLSLGPHTRCLGQFGLAFELGDGGQRASFRKRLPQAGDQQVPPRPPCVYQGGWQAWPANPPRLLCTGRRARACERSAGTPSRPPASSGSELRGLLLFWLGDSDCCGKFLPNSSSRSRPIPSARPPEAAVAWPASWEFPRNALLGPVSTVPTPPKYQLPVPGSHQVTRASGCLAPPQGPSLWSSPPAKNLPGGTVSEEMPLKQRTGRRVSC